MKKLLTLIALITLLGCASRKSNVSISKSTDKESIAVNQSEKTTDKTETQTKEDSEIKTDKTDTELTTTTTEIFFDNGVVKERTTTTSNKVMVDKTINKFNRLITTKKDVTNNINVVKTTEKLIKTYEKQKQTKTNNTFWIVGLVAIVGLAAWWFVKKGSQI